MDDDELLQGVFAAWGKSRMKPRYPRHWRKLVRASLNSMFMRGIPQYASDLLYCTYSVNCFEDLNDEELEEFYKEVSKTSNIIDFKKIKLVKQLARTVV